MKNISELIELAQSNIEEAALLEIDSDICPLAIEIYKKLFDFYDEKEFSGDIIFTYKSPSLVKNGDYIGRRSFKIDNVRVIGNLFPNYKSDRKYSLNMNRNGNIGDFPHDYFDIYLDHVAKYAYDLERPLIKEYFPLKRAILHEENKKYFERFKNFDEYLEKYYFVDIWEEMQKKAFSDMEFEEFKEVTTKLMQSRGKKMLEILKHKNN